MNVKFFTFISTISYINAALETSPDKNSEDEKRYPPIKLVMDGETSYLLLSNQVQLTKKQKLYCACPKDDINVKAPQCTNQESDNCPGDYTPIFNENFSSCGPKPYGDLKISYYMGSLESIARTYYNLNVFQICADEIDGIPRFAFAAYNIFPSPTTSSTNSDSQRLPENLSELLPENLREQYEQKTKELRETMKTKDTLVPQRLIPSTSIPQWFSKGTTNKFYNLMPQWKGKFVKWNHINDVIEEKAQKNDFTVLTGVSKKPLDENDPNYASKKLLQDAHTLPDYWWIVIRNPAKRKGIVLVMDNEPDQRASGEEFCTPIDLRKTIWKGIRSNENDTFIYGCELTSELLKKLVNWEDEIRYSLFEKEIPLAKERMNVRNTNSVEQYRLKKVYST